MKKSGKSIQMVLALLAAGTLLLNGCSAAKPAEKTTPAQTVPKKSRAPEI